MLKTATVCARIEPDIKEKADKVLEKLGLTSSDAITMLFHQISLHQGLPFEIKLPSAKVKKSLDELKRKKAKSFDSVDALMEDLME